MNKLKFLIISILASGMFVSCQDAYEIVQDGELNEDVAIQNVADMKSYSNGVYATISVSNEIGFTGIFTDETGVGRGTGGQNLDTHRFQLTAANGYAEAIWYGHYRTINRANRLLKAAALITPIDAAEEAQYNTIVAETRAIRAFSHFQLLSYFSTDLENDNAEGVILMDRVPAFTEDLPRSTNGEVFALIESDLNFAYDNVSTANTYKFITKNMINALRARMYLYRGNYTLAQQYAQDVITNSGLNLTAATPVPAGAPINGAAGSTAWNNSFYGTASTNPYRKMFNDSSPAEVIFSLDRPAVGTWDNVAGHFVTNTTTAGGSPFFEVGRKLFNLLRATSGDVRRYANVDPTSIVNPNYATDPNYPNTDVLIVDKYPGKTGAVLRNDLKVFRLSEMYFILAECYQHNGDLNGASNSVASIVKSIRDARNFLAPQALPVYATAVDALKDILLERRLELCFEGHRYLDLKRLGAAAGVSIDRDATDDEVPGMPVTIPITDHRFTMPIPTSEINANANIDQNPGY
ncbi:RagB/SusD family nutrient uptake outer membrane protein [Flavobacterium humi]|uniref:RagB/SusD family nutrient uptake outer membrane protein n=1 Tax=Flavobacterium humi TaxID=2562683 RepID=A0A4Z0L7A9_9FLAO|nr:RagB/SusD family nutrient uptake outer membrane protein [Flavobacterium humi]TGD56882.1 RagB/SusD family nutrient uptake outer membrane protein [Flavobacterium humi]